MPNPDPMAIFEHVYADGHALVDEERAQFAAYQASFADSADGAEGSGTARTPAAAHGKGH
jgi:pyruvate dehydrogenase E1 component alpha subunit